MMAFQSFCAGSAFLGYWTRFKHSEMTGVTELANTVCDSILEKISYRLSVTVTAVSLLEGRDEASLLIDRVVRTLSKQKGLSCKEAIPVVLFVCLVCDRGCGHPCY